MSQESNWRAANTYTYLCDAGSPAFSWEFLRRNPNYRAAYRSISSNSDGSSEATEQSAAQWGLHVMADPDLRGDRAHFMWLPHLNPATVVVARAPDEFTEARSISELRPAFSRRIENGEHWLLDQRSDALPVALIDGADTAQPSAIVIPLDSSLPMRLEAALCFSHAMAGATPGRAPDGLTAQQRSRLQLILRSLDGWLARCTYREIAEVLFGPSSMPSGREWRTSDLRGRIIRLCNRGVELMQGEYLDLLRYPRQFRG